MIRPYLTTRECAAQLGVTSRYIRGEIRDGRLKAEVIPRDPAPDRQRAHPAIRIYREQWDAYLGRYWPRQCGEGSTGNHSAHST